MEKSGPNHPGKPLHRPPPYGQCPYVNKTFQKAATKLDEFSEKCQRGGGPRGIFNPKIYVTDFDNYHEIDTKESFQG